MVFNIEFWNEEKYLPTKRHRVLRSRYVKNNINVDIKELTKDEFPIAFVVHKKEWIQEKDKEPNLKMINTEIRTFNNKLWKAIKYNEYVSKTIGWMPISYIKNILQGSCPYWEDENNFTENSIVKENNIEECKENIFKKAENYIIFDGKVWKVCNEPMYVINTFGLGHNHGGTGFFVEYNYNPNISNKNYFNALEREKAITYGKQVALNRGDTESIHGMGDYSIIEVRMPEMVKRNPQKEHGKGNTFLNSLETMINSTDSSIEAGLLTIGMCMNEK